MEKCNRHDITEILLKVALNTTTPPHLEKCNIKKFRNFIPDNLLWRATMNSCRQTAVKNTMAIFV